MILKTLTDITGDTPFTRGISILTILLVVGFAIISRGEGSCSKTGELNLNQSESKSKSNLFNNLCVEVNKFSHKYYL